MGKTSCASSLAIGFSIAGHMGVYFNAEMTAEQQAIRLAADIAHAMGMPIKHRDIKKGALDNQQRAELKKVRESGRASRREREWTYVSISGVAETLQKDTRTTSGTELIGSTKKQT